jgi:hypothetical protein
MKKHNSEIKLDYLMHDDEDEILKNIREQSNIITITNKKVNIRNERTTKTRI